MLRRRLSRVSRTLLPLFGGTLLLITWWALASDGPVFPRGKGDVCVAETEFMRRNHMELILHQRDETVIRGIRDEPFSLSECVDCHASKHDNGQVARVDAEGQFCASCHAFAAVKMDCFGCHAAVPEGDSAPVDSAHGVKSTKTNQPVTSMDVTGNGDEEN